jgi:hypothetical protein
MCCCTQLNELFIEIKIDTDSRAYYTVLVEIRPPISIDTEPSQEASQPPLEHLDIFLASICLRLGII